MLQHLTAALVDYGVWGILLLAFIDSAGIPVAIGMDALVVLIAAKAPSQAYLGATLAVLGSMAGNLALFTAAHKGGGWLVRKPAGGDDPQRFRKWFRRYGLATVFIPALVPVIPLPLKVFVISAGVLRTPVRAFLVVVLLARIIRYFGEAWLGIQLGQDSTRFLKEHAWTMAGATLGLLALIFLVLRLFEQRREKVVQNGLGGPKG